MPVEAPSTACAGCSLAKAAPFQRFGVDSQNADAVLALAGNPNTGKTTLFNSLTGLRMHVGNWPGKTVVQAQGGYRYGDRKYRVVDLPGTYSLLSRSAEEEVARDFILFGRPNAVVVVCDATALERNLYLVLQTLEITGQTVVALNLMDEAASRGIEIDARSLARDLGVRVAPISARSGRGLPELLLAIEETVADPSPRPARALRVSPEVDQALKPILEVLRRDFPSLLNPHWVALRLLEGDPSITAAVKRGSFAALQAASEPAHA